MCLQGRPPFIHSQELLGKRKILSRHHYQFPKQLTMEPDIKKILDAGQSKLPDLIRSAKTSAYYAIAFGISLFLISLALTAYLSLKWNGSLKQYIFLGIGVISLIASFILLRSYAAQIRMLPQLHD